MACNSLIMGGIGATIPPPLWSGNWVQLIDSGWDGAVRSPGPAGWRTSECFDGLAPTSIVESWWGNYARFWNVLFGLVSVG